ncbi:hypothetical protein RRG08_057393 [Elysia crispata]|uniref:Uncharacterized protein n=1 Tax=Elysia crispata TaxID=231223 RepID=A0AAE1E901_9GAST|nr:hypothetical protein RRG08_057393 [Elysia crispata]
MFHYQRRGVDLVQTSEQQFALSVAASECQTHRESPYNIPNSNNEISTAIQLHRMSVMVEGNMIGKRCKN